MNPSHLSQNSMTLRAGVNPHGFATRVEFILNGVSQGFVTTGTETTPIVVALPLTGFFLGNPMESFAITTRADNSEGTVEGIRSCSMDKVRSFRKSRR